LEITQNELHLFPDLNGKRLSTSGAAAVIPSDGAAITGPKLNRLHFIKVKIVNKCADYKGVLSWMY